MSKEVEKVFSSLNGFDLWSPDEIENIYDTRSADFMIPISESDKLDELSIEGIHIETMINDVGELIEQDKMLRIESDTVENKPLTQYLTFEELESWLESVADDYPNHTELKEISRTENDRRILGLHVGDKNNDSDKKKIFMECGIHAREWISPATCRYMIDQVLQAASDPTFEVKDSLPYDAEDLRSLLDFNWYIIVSMNPDGYAYTHSSDRMWRKNRTVNQGSNCIGVDLNRQFPVGHLTTGGSANPCSSTYAGTAPLNQQESAAWDSWIQEIMSYGGGDVVAALSVHSYSQLVMPPYATGKKENERPNNPPTIESLMNISNKIGNAIHDTHGVQYTVGQSRDVVGYSCGGTTADYGYDDLKIPYTMTFELRDTGTYGFLLPADQIEPTAEEIINSLIALCNEL